MSEIHLKPITAENWEKAVKLKLAEGQDQFVAPNWYTILQGHFENIPVYGIYLDDTLMGLTMYGYSEESEGDFSIKGYGIIRLMIDKAYQNKGYGRAVMEKIIADIKTKPDAKDIYISFEPANTVARHLYGSLGFQDTGKIFYDEVLFHMPLTT